MQWYDAVQLFCVQNEVSLCTGLLLSCPILASCMNHCQNGGTCSAPDTCTCVVGFTGMACETGGCYTISKFDEMFTISPTCVTSVSESQPQHGITTCLLL